MKKAFVAATARLFKNEKGATTVEYALMLALIAAVGFAAITLFGGNVKHIFAQLAGSL